jgi:hypothetical protein
MPLEIRELIIKATVGDEAATGTNAAPASNTNASNSQEMDINLIVEKVMEIIQEKMER